MENPNPHAGKPHPAAPLTPATRPLYREIEKLRLPGWEQDIPARLKIAGLTQEIWKAARDKPKPKRRKKNGNSRQRNAVVSSAADRWTVTGRHVANDAQ